uniref:adipocyte plasma membrane-associated protein isoform X2 n=1 Tax=Ciona intestinalis TaxID=7719 RepID=UPI000180BEEB|nr:adipocyte plasma membrane-associated protein isoform X2 [Ciona intestinalis]|eukprot:XP_009857529.1 adipocyte plasma membrane-associated protein isoform X2 [Ciona intestinalis]
MVESNVRRRRKVNENSPTSNNPTRQEIEPKRLWLNFTLTVTATFITVCAYGYYTSPIKAVEIVGIKQIPMEGRFALNDKLSKGKRVPLPGPESIAEGGDGKLYTGLADGRVVCIHPSNDGEIGAGKVENITTGVIEGAVNTSDAWRHGRPLGIRLRNQSLYVMDAIYGFYVIDLPTKSLKILIEPDDVTPPMKFPDDFDITADGTTVYFTDCSTKYTLPELLTQFLEVMPDNVRSNSRGTYWIAGAFRQNFALWIMFRFLILRQIIMSLVSEAAIMSSTDMYHGMAIEINSVGEIIQTLHDQQGALTFGLTQTTEISDGRLALGSFTSHVLAIVDSSWSSDA